MSQSSLSRVALSLLKALDRPELLSYMRDQIMRRTLTNFRDLTEIEVAEFEKQNREWLKEFK